MRASKRRSRTSRRLRPPTSSTRRYRRLTAGHTRRRAEQPPLRRQSASNVASSTPLPTPPDAPTSSVASNGQPTPDIGAADLRRLRAETPAQPAAQPRRPGRPAASSSPSGRSPGSSLSKICDGLQKTTPQRETAGAFFLSRKASNARPQLRRGEYRAPSGFHARRPRFPHSARRGMRAAKARDGSVSQTRSWPAPNISAGVSIASA